MKPSRPVVRHLLPIALMVATQASVVTAQIAEPDSPANVRAVRFHVEPGQTRVWLETGGAVLYTHYSPDPLTLVVDLPGVDISALEPRTVVGSREVEAILAKTLDGVGGRELARVEIKLATIAPYQITGSEQALTIVFDGGGESAPIVSSSPESYVEPAAKVGLAEPEITVSEPEPIREALLTPPAQPEVPQEPASIISGISHEVSGEVLKVRLNADGRLDYTSFELDGPSRLVFDFNGVLNAVERSALDIEALGVARVRVAQFSSADPQITRVVFDLDGPTPHRATDRLEGLEIAFARSTSELTHSPTFASIQPDEPPEETQLPVAPAQVFESAPALALTAPEADVDNSDTATQDDYALEEVSGPVEAAADTGGADPASVTTLTANSEGAYVVRDASMTSTGAPPMPPVVTAQNLSLSDPAMLPMLPVPPPQEMASTDDPRDTGLLGVQTGEIQYVGDLISLDFKDGDIQDIFRLFADISGLNIVVQPGVSGRITLKLTEVPWDQALELVLKTNKLGFLVEGNVIRIAPLSELASEEAEKRALAEEQALAGELITDARVLSYAKSDEIMPLLQRNLSARGDIVVDARTNTVIFTDLTAQVVSINALIDQLDTPIPGVEIEARIVVTTRTFARQLGVQWGFTSNQTQALGNTTELTFPNRIQLDGQSVGSNSVRDFTVPGANTGGLAPPSILQGDATAQRGYAVNLPFAGAPTGAVGLSLGSITGAFNIDAAISAAERRGQVRIISAPKIITQNNKAAEIKQGTTFPVQVVANNTITVQFKEALLDLAVTPQITSAETIILDIEVNNDSLDFGRAVNGIPSIVTQAATTQVLVADGSTTVIGGVFVNTQQLEEQYVPLLHKIPVLGYLFKTKNVDTRNEELLIFLTPRIRKDTV